MIQSSWAVGWAWRCRATWWCSSAFAETTAWRVLMCMGILPALLILYIRRKVKDPEVFKQADEGGGRLPLERIFRSAW